MFWNKKRGDEVQEDLLETKMLYALLKAEVNKLTQRVYKLEHPLSGSERFGTHKAMLGEVPKEKKRKKPQHKKTCFLCGGKFKGARGLSIHFAKCSPKKAAELNLTV